MRTRLRARRLLCAGAVAVLGGALLLAIQNSALAASTGPATCVLSGSAAGQDVNSDTIISEIQSLESQGMTGDAIDAVLASDWCLVKVSQPDPNATPDGADTGDVHWVYAEIYWSYTKHHFFAASKFNWINHDYSSDASIFTSCGSNSGIGGNEGSGLRLSGGTYTLYGQTLYIGGDPWLDSYDGSYSDYKHVATNGTANQYGVGFRWQDNTRYVSKGILCQDINGTGYMDYDTYKGWLAMEFLPTRGLNCQSAQVFTGYWHTWNSGAVTGFNISANGFGTQVTDSHYFSNYMAGQVANMCNFG